MIKLETAPSPAIEHKFIYPPRAFEYVDQAVDRIKKLENGEEQKTELTDTEKEKLLVFEKSLGDSFEKTYKISVNSTTLYLDYFATEEGRKSLWEKTGLELNSNDPAWIKDFILSNSELISKLSSSTRVKLSGEALAYKD